MAIQCSGAVDGSGGADGTCASPPARLVPLLALACGSSVATVYFAQPLLVTLGERFALGSGLLGAIVTVTQLGYAAGLLLLVPLGDLLDHRRLVTGQSGLLALALLAAGLAPGVAALLGALAVVGLLAVVARTMVAAAAALTPPDRRGRAVGTATGGIVTGILLARAAAGGRPGRPRRVAGGLSGVRGRHRRPRRAAASCSACGHAARRGARGVVRTTGGHGTNQTLIHAVRPDAGSRIIGGYMVFYSAGSSLGALGSSLAYATAGRPAVTALGASFSLAALLLWATTHTHRMGLPGDNVA